MGDFFANYLKHAKTKRAREITKIKIFSNKIIFKKLKKYSE